MFGYMRTMILPISEAKTSRMKNLLQKVTVIRGLDFDPGLWSGESYPGFEFDLGLDFDPGLSSGITA